MVTFSQSQCSYCINKSRQTSQPWKSLRYITRYYFVCCKYLSSTNQHNNAIFTHVCCESHNQRGVFLFLSLHSEHDTTCWIIFGAMKCFWWGCTVWQTLFLSCLEQQRFPFSCLRMFILYWNRLPSCHMQVCSHHRGYFLDVCSTSTHYVLLMLYSLDTDNVIKKLKKISILTCQFDASQAPCALHDFPHSSVLIF
jgi:hypothetical protein